MGHGVYAVSFERDHRVWVYDLGRNWEFIDQAIPETLDGPPGREHWPENGGMEALSTSPLGGLWAGVEYPLIDGQSYTLWQFQVGGDDVAHSLRFEPGFGLTGLTPYDGESFLLLERNWSRQVGNHIRIRHIGLDHLDGALHGELLAQLTPEMSVDNFEGIAYGAMANGEERILLISDDNFNESQSTLLLSFSIIPADNDEG